MLGRWQCSSCQWVHPKKHSKCNWCEKPALSLPKLEGRQQPTSKAPASQPSGVVQSAWDQLKAKGLAVAISKTESQSVPVVADVQLPVSTQAQPSQEKEGDVTMAASDTVVVEDDCDADLVHKLEAAHEMCVKQFGESSALATVALQELQQARDKARKEKPLTSRLHLAARKVEQLQAKIPKD